MITLYGDRKRIQARAGSFLEEFHNWVGYALPEATDGALQTVQKKKSKGKTEGIRDNQTSGILK